MRAAVTFLSLLAIIAGASAQLRVVESGQVIIGEDYISSGGVMDVMPSGCAKDTTATLRLQGNGKFASGSRISFGDRGDVSITETAYSGKAGLYDRGAIQLKGAGGFVYSDGTKNIVTYDPYAETINIKEPSTKPFAVSIPILAPQFLTTSDARNKTDISELEDVGDMIGELVPVSYLLRDPESTDGDSSDNGMMKSAAQGESKHQYGFLAQDVKNVYPDLVYETGDGDMCIDYTGFIAILVDAVKKLQTKVASQQQEISELKEEKMPELQNEENGGTLNSLSQNRPNPFNSTTTIECSIAETVGTAFLCVYDLNGSQKLRMDIHERGKTQISIDGSALQAGMYIYTLIADGVEIDSKRMILTE